MSTIFSQCDHCEKEFDAAPDNFGIYDVQAYLDGVEVASLQEEAHCFCDECIKSLCGDDDDEEWKE